MKSKWLTQVFILFLLINFQSSLFSQSIMGSPKVFNGDVELNTQAEVKAFGLNNYTRITGFLLIRGDDITDLTPLSDLDTIGHSLFFEYNRKLTLLAGFDNLIYIGGGLYIDSNTELDSVATFGKVKKIKGPLVLRDNYLLRECCAFYPLVSGQQGVIWGGLFIKNNKGCRSEKELRENCDADSDNDGVDDSMDGCPNDSLKIVAGTCGCGVSELDSDKDGTPDCKDECPNDPEKNLAGDCGCGKEDIDSDKDGVADCKDECPYNADITKIGICGCTNPRITNLKVTNRGNCNDNGTSSALDDTFSADVTLTFERVPTSGTVLIQGDVNASISFSEISLSKTYILSGLAFKADGGLIEVIATFEGNTPCTYRRVFGIFAPKSCSSGACNPPNNITIDTENYPNGALISWNDLGIGVEYEIDYRSIGNSNWQNKSAKTNQLQIGNLLDYTEYEYQIRSSCDSQKLSNYTTGKFTTGGKECKLIRAEVQNINCNDNQTPEDNSDDYFTFSLYVEGTNVGNGYTLTNIEGENKGQYNTLSSFRTTSGTLGNGDISIVITDNSDANCQIIAAVADPGMCSNDCQINYITIDTILKCWDRGSRWVISDDFFTADLTVYFTSAPALGELKLTGKTRGKVSTEILQNVNSYTFKKVKIPATGKEFTLGAEFTNGLACNYSTNFSGVLIKDDKICWQQCNIMNAQVLNVQCANNNTPNDISDDYLTFEVITTGVNLEGNYRISNVAGTNLGRYNQPSFFRTNSGINSQKINLEITDENNLACSYSLTLSNKCKSNGRTNDNRITLGKNKLKLYPNPARSELMIAYDGTNEKVQIEVVNLLGQSVIFKELVGNRLDIRHLEKGVYHLVIKQGSIIQAKKFVKE